MAVAASNSGMAKSGRFSSRCFLAVSRWAAKSASTFRADCEKHTAPAVSSPNSTHKSRKTVRIRLELYASMDLSEVHLVLKAGKPVGFVCMRRHERQVPIPRRFRDSRSRRFLLARVGERFQSAAIQG